MKKYQKYLSFSAIAFTVLFIATPICEGVLNDAQGSVEMTTNAEKKVGPQISFLEKTYNFGMVSEKGGPVSHDFEFTNTGDEPLVIISATASCGCTRPTYPTAPIAPGKKGKIKVTFLPDGRPGEFVKAIKVRTNADNSKKVSLAIKGTVK